MAITGETGAGVVGAEAYGADPVAFITAYWAARTNDPLAAIWAAATTDKKEGGARSAAAYLDANWGPFYIGLRKAQTQGRLWPRVAGKDDDGELIALTDALGNELPALPPELLNAQAELAARAASGPLLKDAKRGGKIKRVKGGSAEVEFADGAPLETTFGIVKGILAPILNGSQPGAANPTWYWL